ncbi:phospholipase D-like domain-containing protein [Peribacillus deserti]|nr:phospholipase D-like domain-containing protein [Peribacillus deserti]
MKISVNNWTNTLKSNMVNFINYYLSKGPLLEVVERCDEAVKLLDRCIPFNEAAKYRQFLGGVFTSHLQLINLPGMNLGRLEHLAYLLKGLNLNKLNVLTPKTTSNNEVDAYVNGPDCLRVFIDEINKAERYIHLSVMLFFNDKSGNQVAEALIHAIERGVIVRLMVDYGVTAIGYDKSLAVGRFEKIAERLEAAGCKIVDTFHTCYDKKDWPGKRAELASKGVPESALSIQDYVQEETTIDLNVINHRKFMVIDGITAVMGSLNIGDQYMYETAAEGARKVQADSVNQGIPGKKEQWHDGCFRIRGAASFSLNEIFSVQWTVLGGDVFNPSDAFYFPDINRNFGSEECTIFSSFPGNPVNLIQDYYLSLIKYAADETIIINPYLIDQSFWDQLQNISKEQSRHIAICNPLYVNDLLTNRTAVRSNMYQPFLKGVSFYDYSETGRFSHWKIAYDKRSNCVFHGSYNINERSACHDFELGVLIKGKSFAQKMRKIIDFDLSVSNKITNEKEFFKHPLLHPSTYIHKITKGIT